ncbi:MAG: NAD(P)/FAD-dependent oxidoreductase [Thermoflexales bacterium]
MNIAIIGAGAAGLAAAHDLLQAGCRVTLFEAGDRPGGLAAGFKMPHWDWSLEKFYHHWFESDSDVLKLADEIGVRERVIFKRPITVSYWNGRFYPLDSPTAALKFPGLSLPAKLPFGLATIYLKYLTANWRALERYTAHAWASRWMGRRAYEVIWQPLLEGKFGDLYQQVNMAWLWARIKARSPRLGTFIGGFQAFFDALAARAQALGGVIHYSTRVEELHLEDAPSRRWRVRAYAQGSTFEGLFDVVLSTTSPRVMARLAPQLPPDYLGALSALQSLGAVVVIFALDRQLDRQGYYWHNLPKSAGFPYLAMCEHTNFVAAEHFGGQHLIYCGDYLPPAHPYFSMTEDELRSAFLPSLARFNPQFDPAWVQDAWVFRETYAQPVPFVNHSRRIPPVKTPLPGLFFASMSQVYPWDRGTNYAIRLGRQTAAAILASASDG